MVSSRSLRPHSRLTALADSVNGNGSARGLDRGLHALDRKREIVDRGLRIAGRILDRSADRAGLGGASDRPRGGLGFVGAAIFEVGAHRQIGGSSDGPAILDDRLQADLRSAERIGEPQAGGGQCLEAAEN
ncbi:MAG: hypothetical protein JWO45_2082 [Spartobacteria bacterium]|nr:hypothetical protein [Spartobacteria bacterium]